MPMKQSGVSNRIPRRERRILLRREEGEMARFDYGDDSVVVVIGSGAGGGTLANELCQRGLGVVLLEAGKRQSPASFINDEWQAFRQLAWTDPRTSSGSWRVARDFPELPAWICKTVGGTTTHWAGASLRIQPHLYESRTRTVRVRGVSTSIRLENFIWDMLSNMARDASLAFYRDVLDLDVSHRLDFEDFSLVYLRNAASEAEIELTWNRGREEPYGHADGYGHVAFAVDDVYRKHAALVAAGYAPLPVKEFSRDGELLARFFFIQDPDGYKIELIEAHGHYR